MDNINNSVDAKIKKARGRPAGLRLSEETKDKIRRSRFGTHHSKKTRNKISTSLIRYFKEKDPLSRSMQDEYENFPRYVGEWLLDNEELIDQTDHVMTEKKMLLLRQLEICFGFEIDKFSHNATPEFFVMLKEELIEKGLTKELEILYSLF